jgi:hypothetical protein
VTWLWRGFLRISVAAAADTSSDRRVIWQEADGVPWANCRDGLRISPPSIDPRLESILGAELQAPTIPSGGTASFMIGGTYPPPF